MSRRNEGGLGWVFVFLALPFIVAAAAGIGSIMAMPALVPYLLVVDPVEAQNNTESLYGLLAASPCLALLLAWVIGRRRWSLRENLIRAVALLAASSAAALAVLLAGDYPGPMNIAGHQVALELAVPAASLLAILVAVPVIRFLDGLGLGLRRAGAGPLEGEIWWGTVAFRNGITDPEGNTGKDRPFVVLRVFADTAEVLQITTQDKSHRDDHIPFSPGRNAQGRPVDRWLELVPRQVPRRDFRRRDDHRCPPKIWRRLNEKYAR